MREERLMILKMIEEQKITAEEGLALLEQLAKTEKPPAPQEPQAASEAGHSSKYNLQQIQKMLEDTAREVTQKLAEAGKTLDLEGKFKDFMRKIDKKLHDFRFDFPFSSNEGTKVLKSWDVNPIPSEQVRITALNGNVACKVWERDYAHIEAAGVFPKTFTEQEAGERMERMIVQHLDEDVFRLSVENDRDASISLDIWLPKNLYESVTIQSSNGKITVDSIEAEHAEVESSNGTIRVNGLRAERFGVKTSNGAVELSGLQAEQGSIQTQNGKIEVHGSIESLQCETTNGKIRIEQERRDESDIRAKTTNGGIEIIYPRGIQGVAGELKTSNGQIHCHLPDPQVLEHSEQLPSIRYVFRQGEEARHNLSAETVGGSITVKEND